MSNNAPRSGSAVPRLIRCLAEANGRFSEAAEIARDLFPGQNNIAATLRDYVAPMSDTGNPLAPSMQAEIFSWYRDASLVGRLSDQMRGVPFKVAVPTELESAATGAWLPRASLTPVRALNFSEVALNSYLCGFVVVINAELAKQGGPKAEAEIQRIITAEMARFIDASFLSPDLAAVANVNPAGILASGTPYVSGESPITEFVSEPLLVGMARQLETYGNPTWIMHPSVFAAYGVYKLVDWVNGAPMLMGWPLHTSAACPDVIALVDLDRVLLADDGETYLEKTERASITMGDGSSPETEQLVSLFQNNMMAFKVTRRVSWELSNSSSAVYQRVAFVGE